jgi:pimeloyl-ACP methyl ester carboxylesterase
MGIDQELLEQHLRFEDPVAGFSEEFIQPRLGLGRTVGVISRPLGPSGSVGWVICHSFGIEQIHLGRMDVIAARELASAGFQVLRFSGQGYGDSEHGMEVVGLSSHVAEARDAVALMMAQDGIEQVGVLGARFGGTVAGLVAADLGLPYVGMWDPVVRGKNYIRDLVRSEVLSEIAESGNGGGEAHLEQIQSDLQTQGWADIRGWPLSRDAYEEISGVDLSGALGEYRGSSLLVALSRSSKVSRPLQALYEVLAAGDGQCTLSVVQDPLARQFGQFRWRTMEGGSSKRDTQLELNERIATVTAGWASERMTSTRAGAQVTP